MFSGQEPSVNARIKNLEAVLVVLNLVKFHFIDDAVLQVSHSSLLNAQASK